VRSQLAGKLWIDTGCAEQLAAIGERLLKRALDGVGPDEDLGDFVLIEELLELAVPPSRAKLLHDYPRGRPIIQGALLATTALLKKAPFRIRSPIAGHLTITNRKVAEVADCAVRDRRKGSRQTTNSH